MVKKVDRFFSKESENLACYRKKILSFTVNLVVKVLNQRFDLVLWPLGC